MTNDMSKETEDLLRMFGLIAVFAFILILALNRIRGLEKELAAYKNAPADTVTVIRHDTVKVDSPVPVYHYKRDTQYVVIPDTQIIHDTVLKLYKAPREFLVYKDTAYRAVVSGVQPRLDSIEIYRPTVTQTVTKYIETKKKPRYGLGIQAGYGYNGSKWAPYVGAGVQYNFLSW